MTDDEIQKIVKNIFQQMEGTTYLDENNVLWIFTNGRWQAGCVYPKELKKWID